MTLFPKNTRFEESPASLSGIQYLFLKEKVHIMHNLLLIELKGRFFDLKRNFHGAFLS